MKTLKVFSIIYKQIQIYMMLLLKLRLSSNGNLKNLLDIENTTNDFYTENSHYSWIWFEFKKYRVNLSGYTIRSYNRNNDEGFHPKSWVIERSENENEWTNKLHIVHTFPIQQQNHKKFK